MSRIKADVWIGLTVTVFCAFAGWRTLRIPSVATGTSAGPNFVPWMMIGGIVFLCLALIARSFLMPELAEAAPSPAPEGESDTPPAAGSARTALRICAFIALLIAYAAFFMPLGYFPTTAIVFICGMLLLGERNWLHVIVLPLLLTTAIYFSFTHLLGVWLP